MSVKSSIIKSVACSLFFGLFCSTLFAQTYPDRPIKLIVPFAPGGPNDLVARIIAPSLGEALKQTIIIENKAGAGGNIGTAFVAKAKPDGYTLLLTTSSVAANMILYKDTGYDLEKEFIGVVNIASAPNIYCVPKDSVIASMNDLLTNPKYTKINYASPGTGSTAHLGMAYLFKKSSKVDAVHIPYKGGAPAMNAAMASEVDVASAALPAAYTFVKANKIRALAFSSKNRLPHLPEVPTLTELGYPNQEITTWAGIFSPQNTSPDITSRINAEMIKILQNPQTKEKLLNSGFIVEGGSIQSFKETIHQELEFWKTVVQVTGSNLL
jgi:tripartite-type tricarboxylate transporter receptor subunit TctC